MGNNAHVPATRAEKKESEISFTPLGASDELRLSVSMVSQFIAVPTRSGKKPTFEQCVKFIMLCKGKRANPFEGDCFLIGYDMEDGSASFSMVCGIELFLKRAESHEEYDGMEAGVIITDSTGELVERPGSFMLPGEKLLGGWAKVYRKDRQLPEYKTVNFEVYNTGRSRWKKDPGGQIVKVASSQALRQAFPTALGGLYTDLEMEEVTRSGHGMLTEAPPILDPVPRISGETPGEPSQDEGKEAAEGEDTPEREKSSETGLFRSGEDGE